MRNINKYEISSITDWIYTVLLHLENSIYLIQGTPSYTDIYMKAKSIKGSSPEELDKALEKAMEDNYKPTLAFVFISIKQDLDRNQPWQ
jgi:hypothetical protein